MNDTRYLNTFDIWYMIYDDNDNDNTKGLGQEHLHHNKGVISWHTMAVYYIELY